MIRIRRLTDYAIVLLVHLGAEPRRVFRASELSRRTGLPRPTVGKVLRALTRKGLLVSHRGAQGGYSFAAGMDRLSIAEVIAALEGPVGLTLCAPQSGKSACRHESHCPVQRPWQQIQRVVLAALQDVSLGDLIRTGKPKLPLVQSAGCNVTGAYPGAA